MLEGLPNSGHVENRDSAFPWLYIRFTRYMVSIIDMNCLKNYAFGTASL